jgi:hypothetical protein
MILSIDYMAAGAPMGDAAELLHRWRERLGIGLSGGPIAIDPMQVTGEDGLPGAELVGVVIEAERFTIVHTRPLDESDIVHELLHVAHPAWSHEEVELWTGRLLLIASEA